MMARKLEHEEEQGSSATRGWRSLTARSMMSAEEGLSSGRSGEDGGDDGVEESTGSRMRSSGREAMAGNSN